MQSEQRKQLQVLLLRTALVVLVFSTSAMVLVIEILATRILAPYVGLNLHTYTSIIGVVLAGIAVGAWAGGKLADRDHRQRTMVLLLAVSGLLTVATLPITKAFSAIADDGSALSLISLVLFSFFAPAAVLSAIHPIAVKIRLENLDDTGKVVGGYSALATVGALAGTFLTGFLLIPLAPTTKLIVFAGCLLLGAAATAAWLIGQRLWSLGLLLLAFTGIYLSAHVTSNCDIESSYNCAKIVQDPERASGRLLYLDDRLNSYVDIDDPTYIGLQYMRQMVSVLDRLPDRPHKVLHVGGAGLTIPAYLQTKRPTWQNTVLELDPKLIELDSERLGWHPTTTDIVFGDARLSLQELIGDHYQVVIGDAFGSGGVVPWQLTTMEAIMEIKRVLSSDGIYLLNTIDYPPARFAASEAKTLGYVFEYVILLLSRKQLAERSGGNYVLFATDDRQHFQRFKHLWQVDNEPNIAISGRRLERFTEAGQLLTDDYAPTDQLIDQSRYR